MIYGYGDPAVLRVEPANLTEDTWYYLLSTSNDAPDAFPILRSKNGVDWEFVTYVFPKGNKPPWAADGRGISDYWAPEMHKVGNEFRVYFVAREKESRELCIGVARALQPAGPFVADGEPLLKGNVIDPHVFVARNGTAYLYWKEDNNDVWPQRLLDMLYENPVLLTKLFQEKEDLTTASFILTLWPWARLLEPMERFQAIQVFIECVIAQYTPFYAALQDLSSSQSPAVQHRIRAVLSYMKTPLFAQPLSQNGSALEGTRTKILENDLLWEAHLVEGMWVTEQGGRYYLFYAGNDFSTDQYGIGVAVAPSPLGPYQKAQKPFLQSTAAWRAPGHPSLVTAPDGKPHLFFPCLFSR
jgi:beta-xylosidase